MERDAPQAWQRGSPESDHAGQPEKPVHAPKATPEWASPSASCQGGPGIVKDVPPYRAVDAGLTLEPRWRAPSVEAQGSPEPERGLLTRSCPQGDAVMGKARMRLSHRGLLASRQGHPGSVPKRKPLPLLEGRECGIGSGRNVDPRQPWQLGSPRADRGDQPGKPGHSLSSLRPNAGGVGSGGRLTRASGLTPESSWRQRGSLAAGHCTSATPVPRNSTGNGFGCSFADARRQEFEPSNHLGELTAKNLPPPGRGPMLRDGPALAIPDRDGETGPATRLLRKTGE